MAKVEGQHGEVTRLVAPSILFVAHYHKKLPRLLGSLSVLCLNIETASVYPHSCVQGPLFDYVAINTFGFGLKVVKRRR